MKLERIPGVEKHEHKKISLPFFHKEPPINILSSKMSLDNFLQEIVYQHYYLLFTSIITYGLQGNLSII